jgi:rhodanese-related sulfurtransferase
MYRVLFVITFAGIMWPGLAKVEGLVAARARSQAPPWITLGPFLQLVHEGNIVIVDVRPPEDYARSHVKNAVNVRQFAAAEIDESFYDRLVKARFVILYSTAGVTDQMRQYAQALSNRGIKNTAFYSSGFCEWIGAGLPVERGNAQNH